MNSKKRILMVALDFPPCKSAGVQRTLKFAQYLQEFGWEPIILTVNESAHEVTDDSQKVPHGIKHIYRSFSFNASRDFSIKGKYLGITKVPDRWWSWRFTAVPLGKKLIDTLSPDVIWSTYPISTAHNIAHKLAKYSGLPWIADYRDPVYTRYDPSGGNYSFIAHGIERKTLTQANGVVFTTQQASILYQSLYPDLPLRKFHVIENGYDEGNFHHLNGEISDIESGNEIVNDRFTLLHSGAIYQRGRNPSGLFRALSILKSQNVINKNNFKLVFRGVSSAGVFESQLAPLDIEDLVEFLPPVNYIESLDEMMASSALLIIQGGLFCNQVPGKLYEYIRTGRPILAYCPMGSATGQALSGVEMSQCADTPEQLAGSIVALMKEPVVSRKNVTRFSRYERTCQLAKVLEQVTEIDPVN